MRPVPNAMIERFRERTGEYASDVSCGNNGRFRIYFQDTQSWLCVLATDNFGWDHVSVSVPGEQRCPTWEEMCYVKSLFFRDSETVVQFHPKKEAYVSFHPYCLHLWKRQDGEHELPPCDLVGPTGKEAERQRKQLQKKGKRP